MTTWWQTPPQFPTTHADVANRVNLAGADIAALRSEIAAGITAIRNDIRLLSDALTQPVVEVTAGQPKDKDV